MWREPATLRSFALVSGGPTVSVILPTFNREAYLREAIASVFAQTYADWELVVIDDGSGDGTRSYLQALGDPRVRAICCAHSGNPALLRNIGVRASNGRYIAFLDSDDLWLPEKLARQVEDLAAHDDCGWSYVERICVDERGREVRWAGRAPWVPYEGWILEHVIAARAFVATSAAMVDRRLFETVGGFDESLRRCQDVDLWIKLAERSPAAVVPRVLVKKRVHLEDRGTHQLDVQAYMNRIYGGVLVRTESASIRRLCRRQRAQVNLAIASGIRVSGRHAEARRALWTAFQYAGWRPGWWIALLKTLLRPAIPAGLLSSYSGARAGGGVT